MHALGSQAAVSDERVARNQAMYRILKAEGVTTADWICECAGPACAMLVTASVDEYERVRAHRRTYIVYPGHDARTPGSESSLSASPP